MTAEAANGRLQSVQEAVDIGTKLRYYWFRGHRRLIGELLPSAHREPFFSARENIEFWAGQRFRLRAPAYVTEVPRWNDHISWLFLAQHYGVPTRLLDWTENILVGLYFAVTGGTEEEQRKDGELWCMNPDLLNWHSGNCRICFQDSAGVRLLAASAFLESDSDTLSDFRVKLSSPINGPLALIPPMQFPRMAAQMSRFTIHLSKEPEAQIKFLLQGDERARYIIPAECKVSIARDLCRFGFTHENLYRDLDSLGRSIKEEILEPDYYIKMPQLDQARAQTAETTDRGREEKA